jgi:hypothetical protein
MPYKPQIGVSVGIELEVTNLTEGWTRNMLESNRGLNNWIMHHDGSTISHGYQFPGLPYTVAEQRIAHDNNPSLRSSQVSRGAEIVSPIIDTSKPSWTQPLYTICDWLVNQGHELPGTFTSTHVHVAAGGLPIYTLKNLLRIWRFLEAPIFRLSCAELRQHRGETRKDYAYCRPLSSPLVIFDQNNHLRPSFDVPSLLKAQSLDDFFLGYGATNPQTEPIRYHPARYCAFNMLPLLTIGTVEFRTFNETTNPQTIQTWVELCKAIVNTAFTTKGLGDDDYPQLPLGYNGQYDLGSMQTLLELPDEIMFRIEQLWKTSDWCKFDNIPLFNSNNENLELNFAREAETLPPVMDGTSVMMYAPTGGGRHSEELVYVFHNYNSYRIVTRNNPIPVKEGRAIIHANFRTETTENVSYETPDEFTRRMTTPHLPFTLGQSEWLENVPDVDDDQIHLFQGALNHV